MTCELANNLESAKAESAQPACQACESSKRLPVSGVYSFTCVSCCARLVITARKDKSKMEALLAAIARFKGSPTREQISECARQIWEKRRSQAKKP